MPSKLGKYTLKKTLGKGAFSKVKLAVNDEDGQHYAVKLHRADDPNFDQSTVALVTNEVNAIRKLKHPNIINVIEFLPDAKVVKDNGLGYPVKAVVV